MLERKLGWSMLSLILAQFCTQGSKSGFPRMAKPSQEWCGRDVFIQINHASINCVHIINTFDRHCTSLVVVIESFQTNPQFGLRGLATLEALEFQHGMEDPKVLDPYSIPKAFIGHGPPCASAKKLSRSSFRKIGE